MTPCQTPDSPQSALHARPSGAFREGPRHGAAMLRRPRGGRPMMSEITPPLRPRFNDWALI